VGGPPSRGPPGPERERRPGEGAVSSEKSVSSAGYSRQLIGQQAPLDRLGQGNQKTARLTALLRRVYRRGERVTVELGLLFAELLDAEDLLEELATRFGGFGQSFLRNRIGHEFPPPPVHLVDALDDGGAP
jgi:hypothetical protein